jgi:hypothetical protein
MFGKMGGQQFTFQLQIIVRALKLSFEFGSMKFLKSALTKQTLV